MASKRKGPPKGRTMKPEDRFVAQMRAASQPYEAIAAQLSLKVGHEVSPLEVRRMALKASVKKKTEQIIGQSDERITRILRNGELLAAEYLCEVIVDETAGHKERVAAAITMLDRQGLRGKPVERTISKTLPSAPEDVAKALRAAMADPGVKAWMDGGGLKQLPAAVAEEVIVGSIKPAVEPEPDFATVPSGTDDADTEPSA